MLELVPGFSAIAAAVLALNALRLFSRAPFAKPGHVQVYEATRTRLRVFRVINGLVIPLVLFYPLYLPIADRSWAAGTAALAPLALE